MADSPVAAYQVKQSNGTFKLSGQPYGTAPYGIAIPKNNGMAKPVLAAVKHLMAERHLHEDPRPSGACRPAPSPTR